MAEGTGADPMMGTAVRLGVSVDALGALAAHLRLQTEGLPADPAVRALLAAIAAELRGPRPDPDPHAGPGAGAGAGPDAGAGALIGLARTFLRQAAELIENPGRTGGWDQVDVPLLQSIGRLSMGVVPALVAAADSLPGLGPRLAATGARFLDVGTGSGWLAIGTARANPGLRVVGIDIFAPALELARANVEAEGMAGQVELMLQDAADLAAAGPDGSSGFDAIWLPLPFLPARVVPDVLRSCVAALRPGGWLLPGVFSGPGDRLSELLTDLRTVRSGGHPWRAAELLATLDGAGLADPQEVDRRWATPVRLFAGRREG